MTVHQIEGYCRNISALNNYSICGKYFSSSRWRFQRNKQKNHSINFISIVIIKPPNQAISEDSKALFFTSTLAEISHQGLTRLAKVDFHWKHTTTTHQPCPKHPVCKWKSLGMDCKQADSPFRGCRPRHVPPCRTKLAAAQRAPSTPLPIGHLCPQVGTGRKAGSTLFPKDGFNLFPQVKRAQPGSQPSIHKCSSMKSDSHPSPLRICYFDEAQDVRIFANMSTAVKISSLERIPDRHMFYPSQNGQTLQRNIERGKRFHIVTAIAWDCSQPDNWDVMF